MTPHEILIAAKALIPDEEHWWRGGYDGYSGSCKCPATAVISAAGAYAHDEVENEAQEHLLRAVGVKWFAELYVWNDAPERTLAEVHAAFDRAIAATRPAQDEEV